MVCFSLLEGVCCLHIPQTNRLGTIHLGLNTKELDLQLCQQRKNIISWGNLGIF